MCGSLHHRSTEAFPPRPSTPPRRGDGCVPIASRPVVPAHTRSGNRQESSPSRPAPRFATAGWAARRPAPRRVASAAIPRRQLRQPPPRPETRVRSAHRSTFPAPRPAPPRQTSPPPACGPARPPAPATRSRTRSHAPGRRHPAGPVENPCRADISWRSRPTPAPPRTRRSGMRPTRPSRRAANHATAVRKRAPSVRWPA